MTEFASAQATAPSPTSHRPRRASVFANDSSVVKARFDKLTLTQWFKDMDKDGSGAVDKKEWLSFMRSNPQLKQFLLRGDASPPHGACSGDAARRMQEDAREFKRLLQIWRDIDTDKNGTLEFEEFVDFFRQSGNLLEYALPDNPKERLATILGEMTDRSNRGGEDYFGESASVSEEVLEEFEHLTKSTLHGQRRRSLEAEAMKQMSRESQVAARIERRHSICTALQTPRGRGSEAGGDTAGPGGGSPLAGRSPTSDLSQLGRLLFRH